MPLYACESCGFTSAAFRLEAAASHREEYPDCDGVIRIVFRSHDRYRGPDLESQPFAPPLARSPQQPPKAPAVGGRTFAIRERLDRDDVVRLTLLGDLDVAVAETLTTRLAELKEVGRPVRLDLSELAFIDSSGIQAVIVALTDARWVGWRLEVAPGVSPSVERAAQIVGIAQVLWPADTPPTPDRFQT